MLQVCRLLRNGGYNKNHHRMEQPWTSKSIRNFIWTIRSISCWFFVYLFLVFTLPSVRFVRLLDCLLFFHLFLQVLSDSPVLVLIVSVFVIPLCGNYEKDSCNSFCALAFFKKKLRRWAIFLQKFLMLQWSQFFRVFS